MREGTTYGHLDIQRYLQKTMSPKEMHEFERALMDDPFLADALEGYAAGDEAVASQHLQEIERSLRTKDESAKVVALPTSKTAWWKVAAIVLVIVSAGVISYSVLKSKSANTPILAQQSVQKNAEAVIKQQDTIGPAEKPVARLDVSKDEVLKRSLSTPPLAAANTQWSGGAGVARDVATAETADKEVKADEVTAGATIPVPTSELKDQTKQQADAKAENEFKGKVVDATGQPLAFANIRAENKNLSTTTDAEGKFKLKAPDSVLKVDVNTAGYANASAEISSNKPINNITVKENEQSLSEVVVTSKLAARKKAATSSATTAINNAGVEPKGGWQNFNQYVNKQADSLKTIENNSNKPTRNVVLEFSVDKNGQPKKIKLQNSVDNEAAEKAKQILLNGPKWTNNSNQKKVTVTIPVQR